jgi:hypothetical protein
MKRSRYILHLCFSILILTTGAFGQGPENTLKTFDKDGLKFSYPDNWTLTDKSTPSTQNLQLTKPDSVGLIAMISPRESVTTWQNYARSLIESEAKYASSVRQNLIGPMSLAPDEEVSCLDLNGRTVSGKSFIGTFQGRSSTGKFYSFILGRRQLTLLYLRAERDRQQMDAVWNTALKSLSLDSENRDALGEAANWPELATGDIMDKAIKLDMPGISSADLMSGRIPGVIRVEVVVDESGKVIEADTLQTFNLTLQGRVRSAARRSKFHPTVICGRPVKVAGYILYTISFKRS